MALTARCALAVLLSAALLALPAFAAPAKPQSGKGRPAPAAPVWATPDPAPTDACGWFLQRLPNVKAPLCQSAQLVPSGAVSVRGVPLYWRDVLPPAPPAPPAAPPAPAPGLWQRWFGPAAEPAPAAPPAPEPLRVLVLGAMHGDELSAASLTLHWIQFAQRNEVASRRPVHWRFVPVVNPDGFLARPAQRTNARGVDLNRNFPTPDWEKQAAIYWDKRTGRDPRRWPGPKPVSEPESRFVLDQMQQWKPHLVVSAHAPYGVLDFDGPPPPPEKLGGLVLDRVGVYPGSLGNYGGLNRSTPVVTIELQNAVRMPRDAETLQMWRDLLAWMDQQLN